MCKGLNSNDLIENEETKPRGIQEDNYIKCASTDVISHTVFPILQQRQYILDFDPLNSENTQSEIVITCISQ